MKKIKLGILIVSLIGINLALVIKLKADTKLTSVEQNNKTIMGCIEGLNSKKPPKNMTVDEWKEAKQQCIYLLAEMKPDPKIVLPTLLSHLENDPDEGVRTLIAGKILLISSDRKVILALEKIADGTITDDYKKERESKNKNWTEHDTLQAIALRSLAKISDTASIPLIVDWLLNYDALYLINFNGETPEVKFSDEFKIKLEKAILTELKKKNITTSQKMTLINAEIFVFDKNPYDYKKDFIDAINDKDDKAVKKALKYILYIKNTPLKNRMENQNKLVYELKENVRQLKNDDYKEKRDKILGN